MTDTARPRREYVAEVVSVGKQQKSDGWVLALAPRPNMKYPDSFYGKVEMVALVKDLKPGQRYLFVLERGNLKKNKTEGSANAFDYFEDLIEVRSADAVPVPVQPQAGGSTRTSEFRTPEQMIRGVALEQATALAVALGNENLRSTEVLLVASKYERYITTGDIPKIPEPPLTPKAQADKDFEEFFPGETLSGQRKASPSPGGGVTPPPSGLAQAPTAAGSLPAARPPGPTGEEINKASLAKHIATLAASAPAGAVLGGGAPETSHGQHSASQWPTDIKATTAKAQFASLEKKLAAKLITREMCFKALSGVFLVPVTSWLQVYQVGYMPQQAEKAIIDAAILNEQEQPPKQEAK